MVLLDILAVLRASRPAWVLSVILMGDGPLRAEVEMLGIRTIVLPLPDAIASLGDSGLGRWKGSGALALLWRGPIAALAALGYVRQLRRLLGELMPDLIHTNGMKAHLLGTRAEPWRLPMVWHLHDYLSSRVLMARLLQRTIRGGVVVAAISESVARDARETLGPKTLIQMVHNAVDLDRFHPGPGDGLALDRASGLPDLPAGMIRIGLMATFARWKGHDVFLNAIARIAASLPCRFYIVGGPIYESSGSQWSLDELKARARALGIDDQRLGFTGHQADPAAALRGLDVVVHASTRPEPFGRVIIEALACGRALIAVHSGGAAELFTDGHDALSSPAGDARSLADRLVNLITDSALRQRLGEAGRRSAEARFGRDQLAQVWSELYESVLVHPSHVLDVDMVSARRSSSSPVADL